MAQIKPTWANDSQSEGLSRSYQEKQTNKQSSPGRCGVQISSGTDAPFCFMREEGGVVGNQHMEHEAKTTESREERKREMGALEPLTLLITWAGNFALWWSFQVYDEVWGIFSHIQHKKKKKSPCGEEPIFSARLIPQRNNQNEN